MPFIPVRLREFDDPEDLLTGYTPAYRGVDVEISRAELMAHAEVVGSTEVFLASPKRRATERRWRRLMLASYLTEVDLPHPDDPDVHVTYFTPHESITRLDPSEAVAVSYFLGLTVCAAMAEKVLGTLATVHSDKLAELMGLSRKEGNRPDLVGIVAHDKIQNAVTYRDLQRAFTEGILLEAKSSLVGYRGSILNRARTQLQKPAKDILALVPDGSPKVASLAYFATKNGRGMRVLRCDLLDPPGSESERPPEVTTEAYNGLILATQLLPFVQDIQAAGPPRFPAEWGRTRRYVGAQLPNSDITAFLPSRVFERLSEIRGPLLDSRTWNEVGEDVWSVCAEEIDLPFEWSHPSAERVVRLGSGIAFGRPRRGDDDELHEVEQEL